MRDKLIELLRKPMPVIKDYATIGETRMSIVDAEHIADRLLAEGVIVPPCKVGTTLYFLYNSPYADKPDLTPRIYKTTNWYFEVDKTGIVINTSDIHSFNKEYDYHLGKTVFLTREQAEKALERSEK